MGLYVLSKAVQRFRLPTLVDSAASLHYVMYFDHPRARTIHNDVERKLTRGIPRVDQIESLLRKCRYILAQTSTQSSSNIISNRYSDVRL